MSWYWGRAEPREPELFTARTSAGRLEFHVCGVCGAVTLGSDDAQMAHAAWHVEVDGDPEQQS